MPDDIQLLEEQQNHAQPKNDDSILPPDLLEEVNALKKHVDTLDNALKTVIKKPQ